MLFAMCFLMLISHIIFLKEEQFRVARREIHRESAIHLMPCFFIIIILAALEKAKRVSSTIILVSAHWNKEHTHNVCDFLVLFFSTTTTPFLLYWAMLSFRDYIARWCVCAW